VATFVLWHQHEGDECSAAYAAWRGYVSPVRRRSVLSSCLTGDHAIWLTVDAENARSALALLPPYVAKRTRAMEVRETALP
jgi:hypothetical protein